MTSCPHCNKNMKMLDVLGMDNWRPTACGHCNKNCMATDRSLFLWFFVFLVTTGLLVYVATSEIELNKLFSAVVAFIIWLITFPLIVKAKKYRVRQYWLPKSRALGYLVYLVVPVGVIVMVLATAIHFQVGM